MKHIHTLIEDPLQLRKQILESALDSTEALKCSDAVKGFERDMIVFRRELRMMMKHLRGSVIKLEQVLPPLPKEFYEKDLSPLLFKKEDDERASPRVHPEFFISQREQLERDLDEIRSKVRSLRSGTRL